jgi:hypothetical protein
LEILSKGKTLYIEERKYFKRKNFLLFGNTFQSKDIKHRREKKCLMNKCLLNGNTFQSKDIKHRREKKTV